VKQDELVPLLSKINSHILREDSPDVSIVPCAYDPKYSLVSSTDFFTPVSQNPYIQGRIAIANVLSDLYAVGVCRIDTVLMILTLSTSMAADARDIVTAEMIRGFVDGCKMAGTVCTGGQTIHNPWSLIGGTASCMVLSSSIVRPDLAQPGDILVLTKPLGTQIVGNLALWMLDDARWSTKVSQLIDEETARRAVRVGEESMMRLNLNAARVMVEVGAHGATDVTGFGIFGHASNLVAVQKNEVSFEITALPIIKGLVPLEKGVTIDYKLTMGLSAETSGGLLVILPPEKVSVFREKMQTLGEPEVWIVGRVVQGNREVKILERDRISIIDV
jgi:selenide,water dikinase